MKSVIKWAEENYACGPAREWLSKSIGNSPKKAWEQCNNLTWLFWGLEKLNTIPHKYQVAACLVCAEGVAHKNGEIKEACKLVRRWLNSKISINVLRDAGDIAHNDVARRLLNFATRKFSYFEMSDVIYTVTNEHVDYGYNDSAYIGVDKECCHRIRAVIPWSMVKDLYIKSCSK